MSSFQAQSLTMLSLSLVEMQEYLTEQIQNYPLLELRAPQEGSLSDLLEREQEASDQQNEETYSRSSSAEKADANPVDFLHVPQTFVDDLLMQLSALELSDELRDISTYVIHSLSSRGYLTDTEEELAQQIGAPLSAVQQAIYIVQSLTPTGVGARDLSECLVLQLVESDLFNPYTIRIVKDHLNDLAARRYDKIAAALGLPRKEAEHWCSCVRTLNPIPSKGYPDTDFLQYLIPEAAVAKDLSITINSSDVPLVILPAEYQNQSMAESDETAQKFLRDHIRQAQLLNSQISRRQDTLQQVISCIVRLQAEYFQRGPVYLRSMTMQQVADQLSIHPSTVSRAVSGKSIITPHGSVSLRSLFTAAVPAEEPAISSGSVKARIRDLIRMENPRKPLSDGELCELLQAQHINVSRRTVSKYRSELHIPTAALRHDNT